MTHFYLCLCAIFWANMALCSTDCGRLFENKISPADPDIIVTKHNDLRSLISQGKVPGQPKGINLKIMQWDVELAQEAQKIANSCKFEHVRVPDSRFYVGQNLYWTGASTDEKGANWNTAIQVWFNEYESFTYPNISRGTTGHYTQVVWADTYLIGCGYSMYRKNTWYEKLYVCNYGPGGNYAGQPPYKT